VCVLLLARPFSNTLETVLAAVTFAIAMDIAGGHELGGNQPYRLAALGGLLSLGVFTRWVAHP
jgi:hypothetical protein